MTSIAPIVTLSQRDYDAVLFDLLGGWAPQVPLEKGLAATIDNFKRRLGLA